MITALVLVTYVLAVARLTRLMTADYISEPLRIWFLKHAQPLAVWATCPWCCGLWFSAAGVIYPWWFLHYSWPILIALALSTSYLVGMFAQLDPSAHEDVVIETVDA